MSADYSSDGNFHGHSPRDCGEHRTVGSHRAWCHDCREWCYPDEPCVRCVARPDAATLREQIAAAVAPWLDYDERFTRQGREAGTAAAVMAVLAEHGLVEREEQGDG